MLLLCFLSGLNGYRAATQSITVDEAYSYRVFIQPPLAAMYHYYEANNHVLFTLLAKLSVWVLGPSEFSLRLPSLLAGVLFFAGFLVLSRRILGEGWWCFLTVALVCLNPYVLDFLSAARGYSLALAGWVWACLALTRRPARIVAAGLLMGLSILANLVYAVPCGALAACFLLLALTVDWRELGAKSALRRAASRASLFAGAVAVVAAPSLTFALHSATRDHFYFGARTAKAAVNSVFYPALFHSRTFLHQFPEIEPVLHSGPFWAVAAALLLAAGAVLWDSVRWLGGGSPQGNGAARALLAGTAVLTALLLFLLRRGLEVPYPGERTGLYFFPLLTLSFVPLLARLAQRRVLRLPAYVAVVPLLCLLAQFALQLNKTYYHDFREDASARQIVELLDRLRAGRPVRMGVTLYRRQAIQFYRQARGLDWLELGGFDGPDCLFDYYLLFSPERDVFVRKYRLVEEFHDPVSGATLARLVRSAVPGLVVLEKAGYQGPIPCAVDFDALEHGMDVTQPDAEAHILRDITTAPGPGGTMWAARRPAVILRVPDFGPLLLRADFHIHPAVLSAKGPQRLTFKVNGRILDRLTFSSEGRRSWQKAVPENWLYPEGVALVEINPDAWYTDPADGQELSFLVRRIGFFTPSGPGAVWPWQE